MRRAEKKLDEAETPSSKDSVGFLPSKFHKFGSGQTLSEMFHSLDQELEKFDQMNYLVVRDIVERIEV